MTASRVSHSILSNGCVPSVVKNRVKVSPSRMTSTSPSRVATDAPPSDPNTERERCSYSPVIRLGIMDRATDIVKGLWADSLTTTTSSVSRPGRSVPGRTGSSPRASPRGLLLPEHPPELTLEVGCALEVLVYAGVPQVGHLIQAPERDEHFGADLLGRHRRPLPTDPALDAFEHPLDLIR